eukprot:4147166-Pleurochrysis_carterae.AAC.2
MYIDEYYTQNGLHALIARHKRKWQCKYDRCPKTNRTPEAAHVSKDKATIPVVSAPRIVHWEKVRQSLIIASMGHVNTEHTTMNVTMLIIKLAWYMTYRKSTQVLLVAVMPGA